MHSAVGCMTKGILELSVLKVEKRILQTLSDEQIRTLLSPNATAPRVPVIRSELRQAPSRQSRFFCEAPRDVNSTVVSAIAMSDFKTVLLIAPVLERQLFSCSFECVSSLP